MKRNRPRSKHFFAWGAASHSVLAANEMPRTCLMPGWSCWCRKCGLHTAFILLMVVCRLINCLGMINIPIEKNIWCFHHPHWRSILVKTSWRGESVNLVMLTRIGARWWRQSFLFFFTLHPFFGVNDPIWHYNIYYDMFRMGWNHQLG